MLGAVKCNKWNQNGKNRLRKLSNLGFFTWWLTSDNPLIITIWGALTYSSPVTRTLFHFSDFTQKHRECEVNLSTLCCNFWLLELFPFLIFILFFFSVGNQEVVAIRVSAEIPRSPNLSFILRVCVQLFNFSQLIQTNNAIQRQIFVDNTHTTHYTLCNQGINATTLLTYSQKVPKITL